ncbi:MAG: hypothetical protein HQK91_03680 [Nitrospirae bacterium]|nr:hypothetical protein [Nitrospirota bacterium]
MVPLTYTAEYGKAGDGKPISQVATFSPIEINGTKISLEMHKIEETGKTHIVARKV